MGREGGTFGGGKYQATLHVYEYCILDFTTVIHSITKQVFWKRLYRPTSGTERGTLCQLRNLINRRNVSDKPKSDVNAAEDFVEVITIAHILTAVMSYLEMSELSDIPSSTIVSHDIWMEEDSVQRKVLLDISNHVVSEHVSLATAFSHCSAQGVGTTYDYASEVLTLGLFIMNFKDAVREGDGEHILVLWKYMMLLFKATQRKNYAIEAFTVLVQVHFILPPNLSEQIKWSRFINVHGLPGHNISADLHMEHLNRLVKIAIEGLGANKSENAIKRTAKAVGVLSKALESYDAALGIRSTSGKHSKKVLIRDANKIIQQLLQCGAFQATTTKHRSFNRLKRNLISSLQEEPLKKWMAEKRMSILNLQTTIVHEESDSDNEC